VTVFFNVRLLHAFTACVYFNDDFVGPVKFCHLFKTMGIPTNKAKCLLIEGAFFNLILIKDLF